MQFIKDFISQHKRKFSFFAGFLVFFVTLFSLIYLLYFAPIFVLKEIKIEGNSKITREEILNLLQLRGGEILYRLNLAHLEEKLKKHHWLEEVIIKRQLPSTLYIKIKERTPIAILVKNNKGYLVDKNGVLLYEFHPKDLLYYPFLFIEDEGNKELLFDFLNWLKDNKKYLPVYENLYKIVLTKERIIINTKNKIEIYLPIVSLNELYKLYYYLDRIMTYVYDNKLEEKIHVIRLDYPMGMALLK